MSLIGSMEHDDDHEQNILLVNCVPVLLSIN